jgi:hypothetical protein
MLRATPPTLLEKFEGFEVPKWIGFWQMKISSTKAAPIQITNFDFTRRMY